DDLTQPLGGAEDPQYAAAGLPYGAKDAPFETVAEVEQVLGMDRALFTAAAPHLTVFSGLPQPDQRFAASEVLQALGVDPQLVQLQREAGQAVTPDLVGGGTGTYSIDSRARLADGRQAVLRAVVRVGGGNLPGSAYLPLQWEEGATPRGWPPQKTPPFELPASRRSVAWAARCARAPPPPGAGGRRRSPPGCPCACANSSGLPASACCCRWPATACACPSTAALACAA